jgi:hypothetical protein
MDFFRHSSNDQLETFALSFLDLKDWELIDANHNIVSKRDAISSHAVIALQPHILGATQ